MKIRFHVVCNMSRSFSWSKVSTFVWKCADRAIKLHISIRKIRNNNYRLGNEAYELYYKIDDIFLAYLKLHVQKHVEILLLKLIILSHYIWSIQNSWYLFTYQQKMFKNLPSSLYLHFCQDKGRKWMLTHLRSEISWSMGLWQCLWPDYYGEIGLSPVSIPL